VWTRYQTSSGTDTSVSLYENWQAVMFRISEAVATYFGLRKSAHGVRSETNVQGEMISRWEMSKKAILCKAVSKSIWLRASDQPFISQCLSNHLRTTTTSGPAYDVSEEFYRRLRRGRKSRKKLNRWWLRRRVTRPTTAGLRLGWPRPCPSERRPVSFPVFEDHKRL
jgi:hypothetical protein